MWIVIFGFIAISWIILKNEKNFNRSIQILEDRINQQQHQIQDLYSEIEDLKNK
ncbi:TPA: hypothetical protein ACN96V_000783 [Acinetobacter baumannii]|uniref:hypothetical protein n=1 Tax=Acinetobacter baumannii TaxID=470 RepID=UPI00233F8DA2|nr:hypothetical protein [Acinetobacter baumannii]MDC4094895.1 hypothetical protein [Acinetobacter baumannii]MDI9751219.1 hypothetical protein [Acinetobacter baumannii]